MFSFHLENEGSFKSDSQLFNLSDIIQHPAVSKCSVSVQLVTSKYVLIKACACLAF